MRKIVLIYAAILMCTCSFGQAHKPSLMVVPTETWCNDHGYTKTFIENGGSKKVPDYERAFMENGDLAIVITVINDMMPAELEMKDMAANLSGLSVSQAQEIAATSKSGADISKSPLDIINERVKSDVIFYLYWKVNEFGPKRSVTYNLQAVDAYTYKQIASASGTGPSYYASTPLAQMIHESVIGTQMMFKEKLLNHFRVMKEKGREVNLEIRLWDNCPYDLEEEFGGKELNQIIEDWVFENTVNGAYRTKDITETRMEFEEVRIPLYEGERKRPLDTNRWARGLASYLKTLGIESKVSHRGLGRATIIIGGK